MENELNEFERWDREFREQNLYVFNNNPKGLLWLKVRAIRRGKQLKRFADEYDISLKSKRVSEQSVELYDYLLGCENASAMLDSFLSCMSNEWYEDKGVNTERLKEDLYKVQYYSWGGDQNNSLDKYLVSRYVKIISDFAELARKQGEIGFNAWNYVQNSWYNNWTSFLIESLFKRNPKVVSAVGEIKSVDFFIGGYPLDLKVTFFPHEFMEKKVKGILGCSTITWLRRKCREIGISVNKDLSESQQIYTLSEKLAEMGRDDILHCLDDIRNVVVREAQGNPLELIRWLYEEQGEMRFGAENRIYLILVDSKDLAQSWKMKRAFSLIEPKINDYIEHFNSSFLKEISFQYKKKTYRAYSDTIFIVK